MHWYGLEARPGADAWVEDSWVVVGGERVLPAPRSRCAATTSRDVLAAAVAARLAGRRFGRGRRGRSRLRRGPRGSSRWDVAGVESVSDSQATIPMAAIAALEAFGDLGSVIIAGGEGKGLAYDEFADAIARSLSGGRADRGGGRRAGEAHWPTGCRSSGVGRWTRP